MPNVDTQQAALILDHGYDEEKAQLELADLQQAAAYRGGECLFTRVGRRSVCAIDWHCARGCMR